MTASNGQPPVLVEGRDYYIENGRWVFTAFYHESRGYCCANRCRHCPYTPQHGGKTATKTDEQPT